MSLLNYDVLRTAKAALDEGLIDQSDYDAVKTSFLKAQQIKVCMGCLLRLYFNVFHGLLLCGGRRP